MSNAKILIVDDDPAIRKVVKKALEKENMQAFEKSCGRTAIEEVENTVFDLIILDINMKEVDGFEVVSEVRKKGIDTPIFLLSGRIEDHDKILGLGLGADDYITKPFSSAVLVAMVKAQLRRLKANAFLKKHYIDLPPFKFDKDSFKLYKNDREINLTSKETKLVKFFLENPNRVFSKEQLYCNIWNDIAIDDGTVMVYIRHLRTKIEDDPKNPQYIKTVWGIGYKFHIE